MRHQFEAGNCFVFGDASSRVESSVAAPVNLASGVCRNCNLGTTESPGLTVGPAFEPGSSMDEGCQVMQATEASREYKFEVQASGSVTGTKATEDAFHTRGSDYRSGYESIVEAEDHSKDTGVVSVLNGVAGSHYAEGSMFEVCEKGCDSTVLDVQAHCTDDVESEWACVSHFATRKKLSVCFKSVPTGRLYSLVMQSECRVGDTREGSVVVGYCCAQAFIASIVVFVAIEVPCKMDVHVCSVVMGVAALSTRLSTHMNNLSRGGTFTAINLNKSCIHLMVCHRMDCEASERAMIGVSVRKGGD